MNSMTKTVATLEDSVRGGDNDKHTLMQDLSAVRDLCTQLEATKDSLQRQLTGATLDREKVRERWSGGGNDFVSTLVREKGVDDKSVVFTLVGKKVRGWGKNFVSSLVGEKVVGWG